MEENTRTEVTAELPAVKPTKKKRRKNRLISKLAKRPAYLYLLCFIIPAAIMYLAYALFGVHPYGEGSVLVLDLNGQYVYYYEAYRDALLGDGSLVYNWSRNLSGNMFGIFAYYLASPFMILVCLFPRSAMCGAIETIQLLKIGTASVSFMHFLRKTSDTPPRDTSLVIFSTMYSLMSYMVVQLMDPMWLDGLIYLPLIALGVRRLIRVGKMLPYIIPLTLMFIAHFYIGYMIGFFTFCYFVYCYFGEDGRIVPKRPLISLFKFGGATVTAILTACCVLVPVYNALKLGKLEFSTPDWSMATQFDFLTLLTKLFPMSYDTVYPEGLPMIYCGTAVLLLVPLFFMNKRITVKRKVSGGVLLMLMIVFMYLRPVDIVWHGFQVPNWLPYRYSFTVSFLLLTMAFEAFEKLDGITPKEIGGVFFSIMVFLFWCEREGYGHFEIFRSVTENGKTRAVIGGIWFSMIALPVYFLLLCLNRSKRGRAVVLCIVTCTAVGLEMLANTMDTLQKIDSDVAYSKYTSYEPYMSNTIEAVEHIKTFDDDPFYRMEATFHRTVNDPIGTGYSGISHSSSVMNAPALKMLEKLGYAYGGHYTKNEGSTLITDSVFDIRYLMDKKESLLRISEDGEDTVFEDSERFMDTRTKVPEQYKLATHIDIENPIKSYDKYYQSAKATYKFYRNPYAIGLGTVCGEDINSVVLSQTDPFDNQNRLYSTLAGYDETQEYFHRIMPKDSDRLNISTAKVADEYSTIKYYPTDVNAGEAHVDYIVEMDRDSELYMFLPTRYERRCNVWVKDEESFINGDSMMDFAGQFFTGDNYSILSLGKFLENEEVRVRVTIDNEDNEAYWSDVLFYSFDLERFEKSAAEIQKHSMQVDELDNTSLKATCTADEDGQYLFTTIPYEPGWIVKVNGKTVLTETCLDSLISIPLEKGENKIEMEFSPAYYTAGIMMTIAGLLVIAVIFLFEYKNGKLIDMMVRNFEKKNAKAGEGK